jgi:hypothetical protein
LGQSLGDFFLKTHLVTLPTTVSASSAKWREKNASVAAGNGFIGRPRLTHLRAFDASLRKQLLLEFGVARWFIFKPKIPIWVNFLLENVDIFSGHLEYLADILDIL